VPALIHVHAYRGKFAAEEDAIDEEELFCGVGTGVLDFR
jgi:hypothetical protein